MALKQIFAFFKSFKDEKIPDWLIFSAYKWKQSKEERSSMKSRCFCCEWDDKVLMTIRDMFEKAELEAEVSGLKQKNEMLQTNLDELQQWRNDLLKESRKRTKRRQQHRNKSIPMMVQDLKHTFVLLAVCHLTTFCWVIAELVVACIWCKLHKEYAKKVDINDDVEHDKLTAALDMFEKNDLVMNVDKLRQKKETMEKKIGMMKKNLHELQQQRDDFLDPAKKRITTEQHRQTLEKIAKLVKGFRDLCLLFLFCMLTWSWVFAIFAVMACICWYCLEEHCRRLEAESRVHELNEKLERLESHYAELEKIHTDLKNAGVDIANNVEEAKVNISVGTVLIEVGKDSTVDTQGYGMKIADGAKVADVNVKYKDVTWKLGERVDVQTRGGKICLDATGNISVNAEAGSQTITMDDNSKLNVEGADITSKENNANVNKGEVHIKMGKNAQLEIKGTLLKTSGPVNKRKVDDKILYLCIDDGEEEKVEGELLERKESRICKLCNSKDVDMKLKDKLIIFDLNGQHNVRTCVCRDCKKLEWDDSYYKKEGFWPIRQDEVCYLIDMELLGAFKESREKYKWYWNHDCNCNYLSSTCHKRWVNESAEYFTSVLGKVFIKKGWIDKSTEKFTRIFLTAFDEFHRATMVKDSSEEKEKPRVSVQSSSASSNVGPTMTNTFILKEQRHSPETSSCTVV